MTAPGSLAIRRYVLRAAEEVDLPPFLGSTLRGAIGRSLRALVCATRMPACEGCPVRSACVYAALHDGYTPPDVHSGTGAHAPPPLWLRDLDPGGRRNQGDTFSFSMAAFGPAIRSLPFVDEAIRALCKSGMGRGRRPVEFVEVFEEARADLSALIDARQAGIRGAMASTHNTVRVRLITPVAIRLKGPRWANPERPPPSWAERLVGGAARRRSALERRWLEVPPAQAPRLSSALADVAGVEVLEEKIQAHKVRRYSSTEGRPVDFHGVVGTIRLGGAGLEQVLPWLVAGEILSVGSGTTFGFGRIEIEVP